MRQTCKYCSFSHPPRQCPADGKICAVCRKINLFKELFRGKKVHSINLQEEQHHDEDDIDRVNINYININSITFNSKCSVITANLNTSSSQATLLVPYKVDTGSQGNIMPFHIFSKLFPMSTKEELAPMNIDNITLRAYNSTTVTELAGVQ